MPVVGNVNLRDLVREHVGVGGPSWNVLEAARNHYCVGEEWAVRGLQSPGLSNLLRSIYLDALEDGQVLGEPLESGDERACAAEALGRAGEEVARDTIHPERGVEPERVPALRTPAPADAVAFEHDVPAPGASEPRARREPGRACSDDRHVDPIDADASLPFRCGFHGCQEADSRRAKEEGRCPVSEG